MSNKKLVVFDMDGTLITGNTWEDFNLSLGLTAEQDFSLHKAFSDNVISYEQWLLDLKALYNLSENKHTKEEVLTYLTQYELKTDAITTLSEIHDLGQDTLLLTGSFQMTADAVAFELSIPDAIATTRCVFDEEGMLQDIESRGNERQAKVAALENFCTKRNLTKDDCVIVGDGGNCLTLLQEYPNGIVFNTSNQEVKQAAKYTIDELSDIPEILTKLT